MARTTVEEVKNIAEFNTVTDSELHGFIQDANIIIDDRLKGNASDAKLTLIEKYLAAHLASIMEQRVEESEVGDTAFVYEGETGMGLEATKYGQQAKFLDPTNRLAALPHHIVTVNTA